MSKKEEKTPKREVEFCVGDGCIKTIVNVETKEIRFVPNPNAKTCNREAMKAFTTLYKDPTATMKLVEKVVPKED
jgi:hypothetical protein